MNWGLTTQGLEAIIDLQPYELRNAFLCFLGVLFSVSAGFCQHDNLRTPEPIVFKFMSVINYGHGKI